MRFVASTESRGIAQQLARRKSYEKTSDQASNFLSGTALHEIFAFEASREETI
jgi:hypothetical protein